MPNVSYLHRWKVLLILVLLFGRSCLFTLQAQRIVINEVMTANDTVRDEDGDTPDWIELFNATDNPVNLQNWRISDDSLETDKWVFPSVTIPAKGFLVLFASDKNRTNGPVLHTSFKLGAGRESVYLYNSTGQEMDEYQATCIPSGFSYGRQPDGIGSTIHLTVPSPGNSNNAVPSVVITTEKDTLIFSQQGGFYTQAFQLQLVANSPTTRIYYTTDGSEPDEDATLYTGPIEVKSRKGEPNVFSEIETSGNWLPPRGEIFKSTVVRAVAYINSCPASPVLTHTYFVDEQINTRYTFPVISIATDRSNLFGKNKGIYVLGENDNLGENFIQRGDEWERPIHLEFFNSDGSLVFKQGLGVRVHGANSRVNPQKSLRIYARDKYGKEWINYQMFPDLTLTQFKTLILRSPDADFSPTLFKDEVVQTLMKDMNLDLQATHPSIVFINGEYWGIHNIRERQDKHYLSKHYGVDPEKLDVLGNVPTGSEVIEGDSVHYTKMLDYIRLNDITQEVHYQYITTQMEMDNYIDYQIAELFMANSDWPDNNIRFWRPKVEGGKWRWLFFDCDFCMIKSNYQHLYWYQDRPGAEEANKGFYKFDEASFLLRSLLQNQTFRKKFLQRFMYHLNTTFEPGRVIHLIDSMAQLYAPEVPAHIYRWNTPKSYSGWQDALKELKRFALERPVEMLRQLDTQFKIPIYVYPNPTAGAFTIDAGEDDQTAIELKLFSTTGKLLYTEQFGSSTALKNKPLLIPDLPNGLYFVHIQYGNLLFTEKLVIQR